MPSSRALKIATVALAALSTAASPPARVASPYYGDGKPTPDACARLGFTLGGGDEDRMIGRFAGGGIASRAQLAPGAPPPPPPPPPPISQSAPLPVSPAQPRAEGAKRADQNVSGSARYAYGPPPGTINRDRYPNAVSNPVKRVADEPVSTFSIDVDTAAYSNVRRYINEGRAPPKDAVRVEELVNYFDYAYPLPASREQPFQPFVSVVPSPWSAERELVHIGLQGYELRSAQQPPLNLVFLIDTSGSMSPEDRLPLAQKALNILIDGLTPRDRVAMVAYAGSAGAVLGPTDGRQKLKMRCALGALHSGGSTAGGQGLALAYALAKERFDPKAVNRVILLTDGDFNVGVADPAKLKDFVAQQRKSGVYLSVYGFGHGNYNDTMMQTLAQNGNGTAAYVDSLAEARKLFRDDFASSLFPIADDVKIQVEFNPAQVSEYRLIGYETRLLNREDFNNDQVDAGEVGAGASVTALYEITPTGARASSDPLRYGRERAAPPAGRTGELAFLKVRYKLPGQPSSRLMERPIDARDRMTLAGAPEATRWAVAVAGFGQKLRDDPWVDRGFGWRTIVRLAQSAQGQDPFGQRAEFVRLVSAMPEVRALNE